MKKRILTVALFFMLLQPVIAQDADENSDGYQVGYWIGKNIIWLVAGLVLLIIVIRALRKKK